MVRNSSDGVMSRTGLRLGVPAVPATARRLAFRLAPKIGRGSAFASACCCDKSSSRSQTVAGPSFRACDDAAPGGDVGACALDMAFSFLGTLFPLVHVAW